MNSFVEPLEGRRLMSATPTLQVSLAPNGLLTIDNAQNVTVHEFVPANSPAQVVVTSATQTVIYSGDDVTNHGTFYGVTQIIIHGTKDRAGDVITLYDADIQASIFGEAGPDTITVLSSLDVEPNTALVTVDGGKGDDTIVADQIADGGFTVVVASKGTDSIEPVPVFG